LLVLPLGLLLYFNNRESKPSWEQSI